MNNFFVDELNYDRVELAKTHYWCRLMNIWVYTIRSWSIFFVMFVVYFSYIVMVVVGTHLYEEKKTIRGLDTWSYNSIITKWKNSRLNTYDSY